MTKKLSFLLVAVLAVFGLLTACDTGGKAEDKKDPEIGSGDNKDSEFTVTFNKNHSDTAGATDANPKTITVKSGETIGRFPDPPTRSQGWGVGTVFEGWYTDKDCQVWFLEDTPITKNITVYANWEFREGTATVVDGALVQIAPGITQSESMHGAFDGTVNSDGSITWQRGGIRYMYPSAAQDYDYVEIEYIGRDKNDKETGSLSSNILKNYDTTADYMPEEGNQYPVFTLPTGKIKFLVRNATGGGMAIQINVPSNAQLAGYRRTMKFTKATFTRGDRYTITFDPNYTDADAIPNGFGVKGIEIGTLPYLQSRGDQGFVGWFLASNDTTEIKASTIPAAAQITNNTLALKAKWETLVAGTTFTVNFYGANIGLTPVGSGTTTVVFQDGGDTGYTFTYGSGNNYLSSWAKFNITLPTGVRLSSFKEVTIQYQSVSGDTGYKPFALLAATTLPASFPSDPHLDNAAYRINSGTNPTANTTQAGTWDTLKFTIDKAKAAGLNGTIQICIYDHSAATGNGSPTSWKIKSVIFVAE